MTSFMAYVVRMRCIGFERHPDPVSILGFLLYYNCDNDQVERLASYIVRY